MSDHCCESYSRAHEQQQECVPPPSRLIFSFAQERLRTVNHRFSLRFLLPAGLAMVATLLLMPGGDAQGQFPKDLKKAAKRVEKKVEKKVTRQVKKVADFMRSSPMAFI